MGGYTTPRESFEEDAILQPVEAAAQEPSKEEISEAVGLLLDKLGISYAASTSPDKIALEAIYAALAFGDMTRLKSLLDTHIEEWK